MPLAYWKPLERFQDKKIPKLHNLSRAAAAGLRVPPTWWISADRLSPELGPPREISSGTVIIRSASPTEDQRSSSRAGQFLSTVVAQGGDFAGAAGRVVDALPRDEPGLPLGAVFVQPLVAADEAGVAFFDGFYFERTRAADSNAALTSGQARGTVDRGHLQRDDPWSAWLAAIYAVFGQEAGGDARLDIEYARDQAGFILLQVRPALFPVRRNETLTLANVRETIGEFPSPWLASAILEAARDVSFLAAVDPVITDWDESLVIELGGRLWNNLSLMFRASDRFGLPRRLVPDVLGGTVNRPADNRLLLGRFLASVPQFVRSLRHAIPRYWHAERELGRLDEAIESAVGLTELFDITVLGLRQLIATAATIAGLLTVLDRIRRRLHLPPSARLITDQMMQRYDELRQIADPAERSRRLDAWLADHGHRGPYESDLARPRFAELREMLLRDLTEAHQSVTAAAGRNGRRRPWYRSLLRPLYRIDERREWYRDAFTRRWCRLRQRILDQGKRLAAAGLLDLPDDIFWLRREHLDQTAGLREVVRAARAEQEAGRDLVFPPTTTREAIETLLQNRHRAQEARPTDGVFPGIALGPQVIEGRVLKADDLTMLLQGTGSPGSLGPGAILVVRALDPSWAVFFPRLAGVVAEVGGELSHASILLREARQPAIVNCAGIYACVQTGDRIRLDGNRGAVLLLPPNQQ
jgi:rifampicin phosphotransferase